MSVAVLARTRFDTELMHFDVPRDDVGRERTEQIMAIAQHGRQASSAIPLRSDRLEMPLDAAVQRVVCQGLVVRPVRFTPDAFGARRINAMTPAPVAP